MTKRTGQVLVLLAGLLGASQAVAQTLTNQSLNGKFFFRQLSLGTDGAGGFTDPRSLMGTITFDGAGHFSFTGQQVIGAAAPSSQTGSGTYAVDAGGGVVMDSPVRSGDKENARLGPEGLIGSSTESTGNTFDLFVAIPAPGVTGATLSGSYWTASLEFPGGNSTNARNSLFNMTTAAAGGLAAITVNGHAANLSNGAPSSQQVTGATYVMNGDGTGTVSFGSATPAALLSGSRNLYVSADGNVVIGGSAAAGAHDFLIGIKAMTGVTNTSWAAVNGQNFWSAGLRFDAGDQAPVVGFAGSVAAAGGNLTWSKRLKSLNQGNLDFTTVNGYSLTGDGSGTVPSALMLAALGGQGNVFLLSSVEARAPGAFEINIGMRMAGVSGTGVFLNPQGVVNAASFAPAGNSIAPGEFIALFGTGLAKSLLVAAPPYPLTLNGVSVQINGKPAPIYFVSTGQINCLVPYSATGSTATITVTNGTVTSNTVTVPLAPTAPGMFSTNQSGAGLAAIRHADFTLVNAASPAVGGETVLLYLTGMGAVNPTVADGVGATVLTNTVSQPVVLVGGMQATVAFSGLAPGFPGLYQMNVVLPAFPSGPNTLPLAISTGNAFHDQVVIAVQ
ncbi:MAG TPA: IPT/TIG domain-containing protein [Candidatus Sulfopaludibacter sp.]|jgi:uncharacterized protein (TIGR03437 family)|nr:IPT/TIG domain-containing protein [Candidatus Sulfopaludibacter sp.]